MGWFWYFLFYSFLGFLLEVGYAWWTGGPLDRKCLLLLPLCPVYGLGACAVLLLPSAVLRSPVLLVIVGGLTAWVHPAAVRLFAVIPPPVFWAALAAFTADGIVSSVILRRTGDRTRLRWRRAVRRPQ